MAERTVENHGHGEHPSYLQHHFDTAEQQFTSGKLGMWLFLATEVLLFAGLFCAYAVYRGSHPEIFIYAHHFLDKNLGALNTVILLSSSLTMAWAVRAAQLDQRKLSAALLALTLLGGCGFLSVKYVEYSHKIRDGLLWGTKYAPAHGAHGATAPGHEAAGQAAHQAPAPVVDPHAAAAQAAVAATRPGAIGPDGVPVPRTFAPDPVVQSQAAALDLPASLSVEPSLIKIAPAGPEGVVQPETIKDSLIRDPAAAPKNVHIFFGIYYLMTGLHGIHVVLGMGAIAWVLRKTVRGEFGSAYYTPVDLVGLYWHLVDLIWIFLFPLLYLIH